MTARRPATWDIGLSSGSMPRESVTVSYAMDVIPDFTRFSVSSRLAARCR